LANAGVALPCYNVKEPVPPLEGNGNIRQNGRITYLPLYMSMFLEPERRPESMIFDLTLSALWQ